MGAGTEGIEDVEMEEIGKGAVGTKMTPGPPSPPEPQLLPTWMLPYYKYGQVTTFGEKVGGS